MLSYRTVWYKPPTGLTVSNSVVQCWTGKLHDVVHNRYGTGQLRHVRPVGTVVRACIDGLLWIIPYSTVPCSHPCRSKPAVQRGTVGPALAYDVGQVIDVIGGCGRVRPVGTVVHSVLIGYL